MQDSYPDTDSDESGIDIEALEREIERSLNAGLESKYTVAIKQFRELSKQRCELKKNKSSDAVVVKAKRDIKKQRKAAEELFIRLAKEYEKEAQEFLEWAMEKDSSLACIRSWSILKKLRVSLFICCLLTCVTNLNEAMIFAKLGGKSLKKILQKLQNLIEPWYVSDTMQSPQSSQTIEVPQTIETADMNVPLEVAVSYKLPSLKLPSLKEAMEAVDQASLKLSIAKQMLRDVVKEQEENLQMAKATLRSLD
jgi:hypothetical protein